MSTILDVLFIVSLDITFEAKGHNCKLEVGNFIIQIYNFIKSTLGSIDFENICFTLYS